MSDTSDAASVSSAAEPAPLISATAGLWTSLVGGPLAALWVGAWDLSRTGRLRRELPALATALILILVAYGAIFGALAHPLLFPDPERAYQVAARAWFPLGGLAWAVLWLRLRPALAAYQATRYPWANPWNVGIAAVIVAWILRLGLSLALIAPHR